MLLLAPGSHAHLIAFLDHASGSVQGSRGSADFIAGVSGNLLYRAVVQSDGEGVAPVAVDTML